MSRLRDTIGRLLGRPVDVVPYRGLRPGIDDDILREAVPEVVPAHAPGATTTDLEDSIASEDAGTDQGRSCEVSVGCSLRI